MSISLLCKQECGPRRHILLIADSKLAEKTQKIQKNESEGYSRGGGGN